MDKIPQASLSRRRLFTLLSIASSALLAVLALTIPNTLPQAEDKESDLVVLTPARPAQEESSLFSSREDLESQIDGQKQTIAELYDELLVKQQELTTKEQQITLLRDQVIMGESNTKKLDSLLDQLDNERGKALVLETQLATHEKELRQWRSASVEWEHDKELADEFGRLYQESRLEVASLQDQVQKREKKLRSLEEMRVRDQKKLDKISSVQEKYVLEKQKKINSEAKVQELKELLEKQREAFSQLELSRQQLVDQLLAGKQLSEELILQVKTRDRMIAMGSSEPETVRKFSNKHVVEKGDTLTLISLRYYGTVRKWKEIFEANQHLLKSEDEIREGMELLIP